jgi:hypothetical protein
MTISKATLNQKLKESGIVLPPERMMEITVKEIQALLRERDADRKRVLNKRKLVNVDRGSSDAAVAQKKRAPHSSANTAPSNVVSIKKPAATLNRPPKPALAFKAARPGTKRALMAEAVLRPEGATLDALMNLTGWDRNTTQGAIIWDLCSQMGMGVRRDGDRYYGSLPEGVTSAVREPAPAPRMAANKK